MSRYSYQVRLVSLMIVLVACSSRTELDPANMQPANKSEPKPESIAQTREQLVAHCATAADQAKHPPDAAEMSKLLPTALNVCGAVCDAQIDSACSELDVLIPAMCAAMPARCARLCAFAPSPSVQTRTCERVGKTL